MHHSHLRKDCCRPGPTLWLGGFAQTQLLMESLFTRSLGTSWSEALHLPGPRSTWVTAFWWQQSCVVDGRDFLQNPRGLHGDSSIGAFHKLYTLSSPTVDASSTIWVSLVTRLKCEDHLTTVWSFCWVLSCTEHNSKLLTVSVVQWMRQQYFQGQNVLPPEPEKAIKV